VNNFKRREGGKFRRKKKKKEGNLLGKKGGKRGIEVQWNFVDAVRKEKEKGGGKIWFGLHLQRIKKKGKKPPPAPSAPKQGGEGEKKERGVSVSEYVAAGGNERGGRSPIRRSEKLKL